VRQDFQDSVKKAAIERQHGRCAYCGIAIRTAWTPGHSEGNAHHLVPDLHGGRPDLDNCVYLCWPDHQLIGHGNAPFGIDKQGGSSRTRVAFPKSQFRYWDG
jgi:predicted restriction endonuclease